MIYEPNQLQETPPEEMRARDRQAKSYLSHGKFPTQLYRIRKFIESLSNEDRNIPVLDLGCGPGPTTRLLLEAVFPVVAVDFSYTSIEINSQACREWRARSLFVQADLNRVVFAQESVGGLMMADFLRHLGDATVRHAFLQKAFVALRPNGWFFLSFFNTNIVNRIKGDIKGSFSGGIHYNRLTVNEVRGMLPGDIE